MSNPHLTPSPAPQQPQYNNVSFPPNYAQQGGPGPSTMQQMMSNSNMYAQQFPHQNEPVRGGYPGNVGQGMGGGGGMQMGAAGGSDQRGSVPGQQVQGGQGMPGLPPGVTQQQFQAALLHYQQSQQQQQQQQMSQPNNNIPNGGRGMEPNQQQLLLAAMRGQQYSGPLPNQQGYPGNDNQQQAQAQQARIQQLMANQQQQQQQQGGAGMAIASPDIARLQASGIGIARHGSPANVGPGGPGGGMMDSSKGGYQQSQGSMPPPPVPAPGQQMSAEQIAQYQQRLQMQQHQFHQRIQQQQQQQQYNQQQQYQPTPAQQAQISLNQQQMMAGSQFQSLNPAQQQIQLATLHRNMINRFAAEASAGTAVPNQPSGAQYQSADTPMSQQAPTPHPMNESQMNNVGQSPYHQGGPSTPQYAPSPVQSIAHPPSSAPGQSPMSSIPSHMAPRPGSSASRRTSSPHQSFSQLPGTPDSTLGNSQVGRNQSPVNRDVVPTPPPHMQQQQQQQQRMQLGSQRDATASPAASVHSQHSIQPYMSAQNVQHQPSPHLQHQYVQNQNQQQQQQQQQPLPPQLTGQSVSAPSPSPQNQQFRQQSVPLDPNRANSQLPDGRGMSVQSGQNMRAPSQGPSMQPQQQQQQQQQSGGQSSTSQMDAQQRMRSQSVEQPQQPHMQIQHPGAIPSPHPTQLTTPQPPHQPPPAPTPTPSQSQAQSQPSPISALPDPAQFPFDPRLLSTLPLLADPRWRSEQQTKNPALLAACTHAANMVQSGRVNQEMLSRMQVWLNELGRLQQHQQQIQQQQQNQQQQQAGQSQQMQSLQQQQQQQQQAHPRQPSVPANTASMQRPQTADGRNEASTAQAPTPVNNNVLQGQQSSTVGGPTDSRPVNTADHPIPISGIPVQAWESRLSSNVPITKILQLPTESNDETTDPTFSGELPPLSDLQIKDIEKWIKEDKGYLSVDREKVRDRNRNNLIRWSKENEKGNGWWSLKKGEKPMIIPPGQGGRGQGRLQIVWPNDRVNHRSRTSHRGRKEYRFSNAQLKSIAMSEVHMIPVRLDIDEAGYRLKDTFTFNCSDQVVTPEIIAQNLCEDFQLPQHIFVTRIVYAIQERVREYRDQVLPLKPRLVGLQNGKLDEGSDEWNVWRNARMYNQETVEHDDEVEANGAVAGIDAKDGMVNGDDHEESGEAKASEMINGHPESGEIGVHFDLGPDTKRESEPVSGGQTSVKPIKDEVMEVPITVDEAMKQFEFNEAADDIRVLIKIDIIVGKHNLVDTFEWDLDSAISPEEFAWSYANDLGLPGEYATAIAHDIHEQVFAHKRSLFLVGHTIGSGAVQDDEVRSAFLPPVVNVLRKEEIAMSNFTPIFTTYNDDDVVLMEKERDKESKRKKRATRARRGVLLPDREPVKTHRTLLNPLGSNGLTVIKPEDLAASMGPGTGNGGVGMVTTSRRAAAIAAQQNINLLAQDLPIPERLPPSPGPPPPSVAPPVKTGPGRGHWKREQKLARLEKERIAALKAAERESASVSAAPESPASQHDNDHNHTGNGGGGGGGGPSTPGGGGGNVSGVKRQFRENSSISENNHNSPGPGSRKRAHMSRIPDSPDTSITTDQQALTPGRRRSSTADQFNGEVKKENSVLPSEDGPPNSSIINNNGPSITSSILPPLNDEKVKKSVSKLNGDNEDSSSGSESSESSDDDSDDEDYGKVSKKPKREKSLNNLSTPKVQSQPQLSPGNTISPSAFNTARNVSGTSSLGGGATPIPPTWINEAEKMTRSRYPRDMFSVVPKGKAEPGQLQEWRLKCLDCPGKIYNLGPNETFGNFEIHLKNRAHIAHREARQQK